MSPSKANSDKGYGKWWIVVCVLLGITIIAGGVVFGLKQCDRGGPVEITLSHTPESTYEVYIGGAIAYEGLYTCSEDSCIGDILQGAGGVSDDADLSSITIHVSTVGESSVIQPQKVNINTAEAWLLEALDGIGPTLAQRIIEYRESNGQFNSVDELTNVYGIGSKTLEEIRDRITVIG